MADEMVKCNACGVTNPPGNRFCSSCGAALGAPEGAPPVQPPYVPGPQVAAAPPAQNWNVYCTIGIICPFLCGVVGAVAGIILGAIGIRKGAKTGGGIVVAVSLIIGIVGALTFPVWWRRLQAFRQEMRGSAPAGAPPRAGLLEEIRGSGQRGNEADARDRLDKIRAAVKEFEADIGAYPVNLVDVQGVDPPTHGLFITGTKVEVRALTREQKAGYKGPYIEDCPVGQLPFCRLTGENDTNTWMYSGAEATGDRVGKVTCGATGNDFNGTPYTDW